MSKQSMNETKVTKANIISSDPLRPHKRSRFEMKNIPNIQETIQETDTSILQDWPPSSELTNIELEAIFYPKFENESKDDKSIREAMLQSVFDATGYLEVSLKHSGSLLLWSGHDRFYSKNSMNNKFTLVGEILLREHFIRCWDKDSHSNSGASQFLKCSDEMDHLQLTCSFECVTSILGDHGEIPHREFLILTGIADRSKERFYSTSEVVTFAQKWRLPHNDVWICRSSPSANALFQLYDTTRERALADSTIHSLNNAADYSVLSMHPHIVFQGNILEGIVIRLVPVPIQQTAHEKSNLHSNMHSNMHSNLDSNYLDSNLDSIWENLSLESKRIQKAVPPEKPSFTKNTQLTQNSKGVPWNSLSDILKHSINDDMIYTNIEKAILARYGIPRRNIVAVTRDKTNQLHSILNHLATKISSPMTSTLTATTTTTTKTTTKTTTTTTTTSNTTNEQTKRISALIQKLYDLDIPLRYKIFRESNTSTNKSSRWLCVLHVLHDSAFMKYHQNRNPNDMMLFRGFCFRLVFADETQDFHATQNRQCSYSNGSDGLMLKMKFLPYMIRTFGCRNGLGILLNDGINAYDHYTMNLLQKWGVSQNAINIWQPFFHEWGKYAYPKLIDTSNGTFKENEVALSSSSYLHHFETFRKLYQNGQISRPIQEHLEKSSFRGLVVVIGLTKDQAIEFGAQLAKEISCKICTKPKEINVAAMANAIRPNDGGLVCCIDVYEKGGNAIRGLLHKFSDAIYIVLYSCADENVHEMFSSNETPDTDKKKTIGRIRYWKSTRCKAVMEAGKTFANQNCDLNEDKSQRNTNSHHDMQSLVTKLRALSDELPEPDNRPGILVFFPSIPGSGKSTLCESLSEQKLNIDNINELSKETANKKRKWIIHASDKITSKIKYWPSVQISKTENPSSIFFADKNAPPMIWNTIGKICASNQGLVFPVFPDNQALTTTTISVTFAKEKTSKNKRTLVYPFSLHYLAICISRVFGRPPNSHDGKLDVSHCDACMVVVKFFGLYEGYTSDQLTTQFTNEMLKVGAKYPETIFRVPFFKQNKISDLPKDLEEVLQEALQLRYDLDVAEKGKQSKEQKQASKGMISNMEQRIRKSISLHDVFLRSLTIDPKESTQSLSNVLKEAISSLDSTEIDSSSIEKNFIKIVSIDVDMVQIKKLLSIVISDNSLLASYFDKIGGLEPSVGSELESNDGRLVARPHVTMAHFSRSSQFTMESQFGALQGLTVELLVTGILYNNEIAALSVSVPDSTLTKPARCLPACQNDFAHITVWCGQNIKAVRANNLPGDVDDQKAQKIIFDKPLYLHGEVVFWRE